MLIHVRIFPQISQCHFLQEKKRCRQLRREAALNIRRKRVILLREARLLRYGRRSYPKVQAGCTYLLDAWKKTVPVRDSVPEMHERRLVLKRYFENYGPRFIAYQEEIYRTLFLNPSDPATRPARAKAVYQQRANKQRHIKALGEIHVLEEILGLIGEQV